MATGCFTIESTDASRARLRLSGEFDDGTELGDALRALCEPGRHVDLDMTDVTFFGSSGLGALQDARQTARSSGGTLHIVAASPQVLRLLELTQLTDFWRPAGGEDASSGHDLER